MKMKPLSATGVANTSALYTKLVYLFHTSPAPPKTESSSAAGYDCVAMCVAVSGLDAQVSRFC